MKIIRLKDIIPDAEFNSVVSFGAIYRTDSMPDSIAEYISKNWEICIGSPSGSGSIYNTYEKTWKYTPEGSMRAADHWNFVTQKNPGKISCPTNIDVPTNHWALGVWKNNVYEILMIDVKRSVTRKHGNLVFGALQTNKEYMIERSKHTKILRKQYESNINNIWLAAEFYDIDRFNEYWYLAKGSKYCKSNKFLRPFSNIHIDSTK